MQADFFEFYDGDQNWFLSPVIVKIVVGKNTAAQVAETVSAQLSQLESLSARFEQMPTGIWVQYLHEPRRIACPIRGSVAGGMKILDADDITQVLNEMREEIDIASGRPVVARLVPVQDGGLLLFLLCHHLVIDDLSVRFVLQELDAALASPYRAAGPPERASASAVIDGMRRLADTAAVRSELDYWCQLPLGECQALPTDRSDGANCEAATASVSVSLGISDTQTVMQVAKRSRLQVGDVIAAGALAAGALYFGQDLIAVDSAIHGRDLILGSTSMANAVGWFAVNVPLVLHREAAADVHSAVQAVHQTLRSSHGRGHAYSLLRYMSSDDTIRNRLAAQPRPRISCNYVGTQQSDTEPVRSRRISVNGFQAYDPTATRSHIFDIDCAIIDGALNIATGFSTELYRESTACGYLSAIRDHLSAV